MITWMVLHHHLQHILWSHGWSFIITYNTYCDHMDGPSSSPTTLFFIVITWMVLHHHLQHFFYCDHMDGPSSSPKTHTVITWMVLHHHLKHISWSHGWSFIITYNIYCDHMDGPSSSPTTHNVITWMVLHHLQHTVITCMVLHHHLKHISWSHGWSFIITYNIYCDHMDGPSSSPTTHNVITWMVLHHLQHTVITWMVITHDDTYSNHIQLYIILFVLPVPLIYGMQLWTEPCQYVKYLSPTTYIVITWMVLHHHLQHIMWSHGWSFITYNILWSHVWSFIIT